MSDRSIARILRALKDQGAILPRVLMCEHVQGPLWRLAILLEVKAKDTDPPKLA